MVKLESEVSNEARHTESDLQQGVSIARGQASSVAKPIFIRMQAAPKSSALTLKRLPMKNAYCPKLFVVLVSLCMGLGTMLV
ncbi:protein of unknown function [Candidatus Nitrotoga arctica]|uniref:Uncharacterized protein n=1 Tax=Candidatus Nitrotoga arctica TaxID=453162 RepID=A0ABN8AQW9_9PROT|nr:protein of unknown function [Candidatus Nitrotoga arctica]